MVDAAMSFRSQTSLNEVRAAARFPVSITTPAGMRCLSRPRANGILAPAQAPAWVEQWAASTQADCFVVAVDEAGKPALALALEVVEIGAVSHRALHGRKPRQRQFSRSPTRAS